MFDGLAKRQDWGNLKRIKRYESTYNGLGDSVVNDKAE